MLADDLIKTARLLANSGKNKPRQADLRRAISTAYYAMLTKCCADLIVGTPGAQRSPEAWHQVYRALEHGAAKSACANKTIIKKFPAPIQDFAHLFLEMQVKRHSADYDPNEKFFKSAVSIDITFVEIVIHHFKSAPIKDRRAFAVFVLFKPPRS